jgi:hypothetical protein
MADWWTENHPSVSGTQPGPGFRPGPGGTEPSPGTPPPAPGTPPPAPGAPPPSSSGPNLQDPAYILASWKQFAEAHKNDPGFDPSMLSDPQYWANQIAAHGGWTAGNASYFMNRALHPTAAAGAKGGLDPNIAAFNTAPAPFGEVYTTPQTGNPGQFTAPTGVTEQNDPGYQFRLDQGNKALLARAAASGTLLNGGTLKAIAQYNQDYASGEFQNVYNRAQGTYNTQENAYQNTVGNALNQYGAHLGAYTTNTNTQRNYLNDYWQRLHDAATLGEKGATDTRVP